jgi:hypothetical protein
MESVWGVEAVGCGDFRFNRGSGVGEWIDVRAGGKRSRGGAEGL